MAWWKWSVCAREREERGNDEERFSRCWLQIVIFGRKWHFSAFRPSNAIARWKWVKTTISLSRRMALLSYSRRLCIQRKCLCISIHSRQPLAYWWIGEQCRTWYVCVHVRDVLQNTAINSIPQNVLLFRRKCKESELDERLFGVSEGANDNNVTAVATTLKRTHFAHSKWPWPWRRIRVNEIEKMVQCVFSI